MAETMICPWCWGGEQLANCPACRGAGFLPDQALSANFMLSEMLASQTASRKGIPNLPSDGVVQALAQLANDLLQALRGRTGPLHIDSGYRSPALNLAVGGAQASAHVTGFAADLKPLEPGLSLRGLMSAVIGSGLVFDQVIWEYGAWVHVGLLGPGGSQRQQRMMIFSGGSYQPFDGNDPRVPRS